MTKHPVAYTLLGLVLVSGLYVGKRLYAAQQRQDYAQVEAKQLTTDSVLRDGDLVFQTSLSSQSKAIQAATHSKYSHCGIVYQNGVNYFVFEAVQPVRLTPLDHWLARGKDGHYVVKRLKNADQILTLEALEKMKEAGKQLSGRNYDLTFEWDDERVYCSELIWKVYQRATGLEIGHLQHLSEFDLSDPSVKQKMKERYGDQIPLNEQVISPAAIFDSDLLITVKSN